jgi:DNA-binding NarL/FixJ family response regulator
MADDITYSSIRPRIVLAESSSIGRQLLSAALRTHGFEVFECDKDAAPIIEILETGAADSVVISSNGAGSPAAELALLRALHLAAPEIPKLILFESEDRLTVVQAFRSGARGVFCRADASLTSLCESVESLCQGGIWANTRQLLYLLDSVSQPMGLQVASASGDSLLTPREEQVVALVADGHSNRHIAGELGLSEHTVKKYLFRIFEKLGISNRVELVLYAVHHGAPREGGWIGA